VDKKEMRVSGALIVILLIALAYVIVNQPRVCPQNPQINVYFCPEDSCGNAVISLIDRANRSVDVAMYSFTHEGIADALIRAKERGVIVRVIIESEQVSSYSQYGRLRAAGIEVKLDKNPYLMHNKFAVVDGKVVATGSFNYTESADKKNDENLIIIWDPEIASKYESEFEEMWEGVYGK
jgi:phosphatidylserine/phosphatidylglycerophosphate/cardiolipin synthase-like enzyme